MKETAVQDQILSDFYFNLETDLLNSVIVKPRMNNITKSNINGGIGLSISTDKNYDDLDSLLKECIDIYFKKDYQKEYSFIDNIVKINEKSEIINIIYPIILDKIKNKDINNVWFAPLDIINWDLVDGYKLYKNRISDTNFSNVMSIDFDTIINFLNVNLNSINDLSELRKYKISVLSSDNSLDYIKWNIFNCLYASVEYNNEHYIFNEGSLYLVDKEFKKDYFEKYNNLPLYTPLNDSIKNQTERSYLENTCELSNDLLLIDRKLINRSKGSFEPCDIFDLKTNNFIHVKKYGSSKILSHLFAQAIVSADLFMNEDARKEIISSITEEAEVKNLNIDKLNTLSFRDCEVTMAIITEKKVPVNGRVNIPFFSMVNVVRTIEQIKNWGYKRVGVMFIESK